MVQLDPYVCDLNCHLDNGYQSAETLSEGGFSYMWGGVKGTHGIKNTKVYFEVTIDKQLDIKNSNILREENAPYAARIGFSVREASTKLGEERDSYCFCSNGMKKEDGKSTQYGNSFSVNDRIGAYADLSNPAIAEFHFTLNGHSMGSAFKVRKTREQEFYPHIYIKNTRITIFFGEHNKQPPAYSVLPGYTLINHVSQDNIIRGILPPTKPELLMTIGLPACGKTTFANNYSFENPEKRYNILGTDTLVSAMKSFVDFFWSILNHFLDIF